MGQLEQPTPHLARSSRHPLPEGEGLYSDFRHLLTPGF